MYRAVFTLLVGLMLSLGGGIGAVANQKYANWSDKEICNDAVFLGKWSTNIRNKFIVAEAKRRGLSCGLKVARSQPLYEGVSDREVCIDATFKDNLGNRRWIECLDCGHSGAAGVAASALKEARRRGLNCEAKQSTVAATEVQKSKENNENLIASQIEYAFWSDERICNEATFIGEWATNSRNKFIVIEAKRRGLTCGVGESGSKQTASTSTTKPNASSAALTAAQKQAHVERQRRLEAEAELSALKAQKEQQQATVDVDNQIPLIDILSVASAGKQGSIKGRVSDNTGVAEVIVDGSVVPLTSTGSFEYRTFVPANGISVQVQATDLAGLTSVISVSLERSASTANASISFDRLNPLGKRVTTNRDALALIVGVADYENTPAKAMFADSDALLFSDYASEKLGIPENRIKTLVDDGADIREVLLGVKRWLARAVKQEQSDVYVFFAGHGLASDDGKQMYLLPYDGAPELLEDTALSRDRLFSEIAAAKPRSVTVFLDTCYSGTTRGPDMLIASRPIAIRAKEQAVPEGFTVMTAAAGDQTAKPLEEAKHGMFSYFLMKGMEGDADANQDNQITAGELHAYVQQNVIQQSSGSQTPELQGDTDRVLVRFQ